MTASIPRQGTDLKLWIAALVFIAAAAFVAAQRPTLGDPALEVVAAFAASLGLALAHLSLQHSLGEPAVRGVWLAPVLVATGAALAFADDLITRSALLGLAYAGQCALTFVFLISAQPQRKKFAATRLLAMGFAAICALFVAEVTLVLYRPGDLLSPVLERPAHTVGVAFAVAGILVCSLAFLNLRCRQFEERMTELATRDGLTGIFNRRIFMEMGALALSSGLRGGRPVSVLMLDLDHFKDANDRHGHVAGDLLLQEVAKTIASCLRECDVLGRYGGEEFCALLPDTGSTGAMLTAERIRNCVGSRVFSLGKTTHRITVSIGVATASGHRKQTISELIDQADAAMYGAKNGGRDKVEVASRSAPVNRVAYS